MNYFHDCISFIIRISCTCSESWRHFSFLQIGVTVYTYCQKKRQFQHQLPSEQLWMRHCPQRLFLRHWSASAKRTILVGCTKETNIYSFIQEIKSFKIFLLLHLKTFPGNVCVWSLGYVIICTSCQISLARSHCLQWCLSKLKMLAHWIRQYAPSGLYQIFHQLEKTQRQMLNI